MTFWEPKHTRSDRAGSIRLLLDCIGEAGQLPGVHARQVGRLVHPLRVDAAHVRPLARATTTSSLVIRPPQDRWGGRPAASGTAVISGLVHSCRSTRKVSSSG